MINTWLTRSSQKGPPPSNSRVQLRRLPNWITGASIIYEALAISPNALVLVNVFLTLTDL